MAKILLAEDDDSMRSFVAKALERKGHEVTAYEDGEDALEAFEDAGPGGFDLLLTDIVMPGLDGIELARRCAQGDPALKIMFITGFAAIALSKAGPVSCEARVLSKPFHLRELVDTVHEVLAE